MKANLIDFSLISGVSLGIELLDSEQLQSDNSWGFVIDLLIFRIGYFHNIVVDK